ncbi:hypothetical protein FA13DRAFT_112338 [Coprinellus micaceus]|uniref:Uncharacterized protein n=1 Tax=Coprinellus micaceus TaxID=71717 RepID=A0A4Y7TJS1_COPMI|nr:hypothetical protein FA13DRAFT_112338 [Coprinellus micaceus]
MAPPGEPRTAPKPEPIGSMAFVSLATICVLCGLFILWRRTDKLRKAVAQRLNLKSLSGSEGRIRLSEDEGPSAAEFLGDGDDDDDDNLHLSHSDTDTLTEQMKRATRAWREPNITPLYSEQNATASTAPPASSDNVIRL